MTTQYIVEWDINGHKFTETFESMTVARLKMIQLEAYGIASIMIIRGL